MRSSIRSTIEASVRRLLDRKETLLAIVSFGASSVYWLALAFVLPAPSYGKLMTLQASVLLVTTFFAFRTFDLLFYLVSKLGYRVAAGFRVAFLCELLSITVATLVCAIGLLLVSPASLGMPPAPGVIAFAFLSSVAVAQGASMARLRYLVRQDLIARADFLTIACWALACASLVVFPGQPPIGMLIVGTLPTMVRTLALGWAARVSDPKPEGRGFARSDLGGIVRFLVGGQIVNFAKNSGVPIETMILAAFCPPTYVAMYRLARSTLGATTAATNVTFQQGYAALAHAETQERKLKVWGRIRSEGVRLAFLLYPLSAGFALVYALTKHDVDVVTLQLVTLGTFLAFLPSVNQQAPIAVLSLEGAHTRVNAGFAVGIATLALAACALFYFPSIATFLVALFLSAWVRWLFLEQMAKPYLR